MVVVTRNRADELDETLGRLVALPEQPPVIVVDNASEDDTARRVLTRHPHVQLIRASDNLGAAGRNLGVRAAATPYVAFSDDDSWWAPGALARAADALDAHPRVALVAARILVGVEERLDPTSAEMADSPLPTSPDLPGTSVLGFLACGAIVRASAYLEVGGFHSRFGVGAEEQLLALDLRHHGHRLQYLDEVVAHHHPSIARDPAARGRRVVRNDLWTAWLRRPVGAACKATARRVRHAVADPHVRAGLRDALAGARWVLSERQVLAPDIEAELRVLER